jgi:hypothetical protein
VLLIVGTQHYTRLKTGEARIQGVFSNELVKALFSRKGAKTPRKDSEIRVFFVAFAPLREIKECQRV